MKKVRLTENDLIKIVKGIINEQSSFLNNLKTINIKPSLPLMEYLNKYRIIGGIYSVNNNMVILFTEIRGTKKLQEIDKISTPPGIETPKGKWTYNATNKTISLIQSTTRATPNQPTPDKMRTLFEEDMVKLDKT